MNIKADKQNLMKVDKAIIIGLQNDKDVKLNIQGELSLDEALDLINTVTHEILSTFELAADQKATLKESEKKKLKEDLYQRAVLGFSLMIDKYHPEGIKTKFQGLTEEAIMKAQDEILLSKQK